MAEHPNAAIARKAYEAFGKGDIESVFSVIADDAVFHAGGDNALTGDYKGHAEIQRFFGKLAELASDGMDLEVHDILANDEHVIALVSFTAKRGDESLDMREVHIWHIADGKMTEQWVFEEDQAAGNAFYS